MGPLTTTSGLAPMVVAMTPWMLYSSVHTASTAVKITGRYSGLHPAIAPTIAAFSTVAVSSSGNIVVVTTSSGE